MPLTIHREFTIGPEDLVLVTGATGFIGARVVENLLSRGFRNVRCFVRRSSDRNGLDNVAAHFPQARVVIMSGNLLSPSDCLDATRDAAIVLHLAAGTGHKSFPDAFINSVVTTRNLLDAIVTHKCLKRLVTVSSFAVYSNTDRRRHRLLDESCAVDQHPELRGEAYCFAKVKQEQLVVDYGRRFDIPYVIVRPGYVYGPGKQSISDRVGISTFGIFLHLGGANTVPLTYVDNCADAIVLAGLVPGVDGEVFNVVDDDLPSSRRFLRLYKRHVRRFASIYVPHALSYMLCYLWERYSIRSQGQLPLAFNRRKWNAYWRRTRYSNQRLKGRLGWVPAVSTDEALKRFFDTCRAAHA
jgi:nucleoside-diphosphate-sugar epimerase